MNRATRLTYSASLSEIGRFRSEPNTQDCVRTAGVGCVSAAPRFGTRQECRVSLRGFSLGLESERVGDAPLPMPRPDGWDCHSPADVKDHAPQDVTLGTPLLYQKLPEWAENVLAKSEALRNFRAKICHSIQLLLNIRLRCGRNRISPDDRREEPRSGRYAGCGFAAKSVGRLACLTGKNCDTILLLYRMKGLTWQT